MITIAAVALVTVVGVLFASMAIFPLLIDSGRPPTAVNATLVPVASPPVAETQDEHPEAA